MPDDRRKGRGNVSHEILLGATSVRRGMRHRLSVCRLTFWAGPGTGFAHGRSGSREARCAVAAYTSQNAAVGGPRVAAHSWRLFIARLHAAQP